MSDCECMDNWLYYPSQFGKTELGQKQGMYFQGCDPIAPDNGAQTWCYIKGGASAASCAGAKQAGGQVKNNQHYWKQCSTSSSERAALSARASQTIPHQQLETQLRAGADLLATCRPCFSDPSAPVCNASQSVANVKISQRLLSVSMGKSSATCAQLGSFLTNETPP